MSEAPKITSVEKTKDPRRVEAGRKRSAISKQAKEKKAQLKAETREKMDSGDLQGESQVEYSGLAMVFAGILVVAAIVLHFSRGKTQPTREPEQAVKENVGVDEGEPQGEPRVGAPKPGNSQEP